MLFAPVAAHPNHRIPIRSDRKASGLKPLPQEPPAPEAGDYSKVIPEAAGLRSRNVSLACAHHSRCSSLAQ
ncbi:hypothetical protein [Lysobacter gummosus]